MSKKVTALIPADKISTALSVAVEARTDDILAIAVSSHEDLLEQQRAVLDKNIRRLTKTKEELAQQLETMSKAQADKTFKGGLDALCLQLDDWGFEKVLAKFEAVDLDLTKRQITVNCQISSEAARTVHYYGNEYRETLTAKKVVAASDEICAKIDELRKVEDELDSLVNLHAEVRRALANIDRVERRARAALARKTLEATEEGRALLETMQNVDSPFHSLLALQQDSGLKIVREETAEPQVG